MSEEEKGKIEKIKLKDVLSGLREKIGKKSARPLKLIKLSSWPGIKADIQKA